MQNNSKQKWKKNIKRKKNLKLIQYKQKQTKKKKRATTTTTTTKKKKKKIKYN